MTGNGDSHTSPENTQDRKPSRSERGKLAQRAYRKRHASKFQKLQDNNKNLRGIISRLDTTLRAQGLLSAEVVAILAEARDLCRDGDDATSDGTTTAAAAAVAAATASQKQGTDHEPETPRMNLNRRHHQMRPCGEHGVIGTQQQDVAAIHSCHHGHVFTQQGNPTTTMTPPADTDTPPRAAANTSVHGGGGASGRAGLVSSWLDSIPPHRGLATCKDVGIRYYLDEGMATFAGCIFWACLTHAIEVFEDSETRLAAHEDLVGSGGGGGGGAAAAVVTSPQLLWQQKPAAAEAETGPQGLTVEPPDYARTLRRIFCRSEHVGEPGFLARLERCRAHYMRCGYIVARRASSRLLDLSSLPADYPWPPALGDGNGSGSGSGSSGPHGPSSRRASSPWWRTVDDMLMHLKGQIGEDAMARLDAFVRRAGAVVKGADDGTSLACDVEWAKRVGTLVLALAQNYVAGDDGPRWDAVYLSLLVGSWVDDSREWIYGADAGKEDV